MRNEKSSEENKTIKENIRKIIQRKKQQNNRGKVP